MHLKVPIRTLVDVPSAFFFPDGILSVRECFNISEKYFTHYQDVDIEIQKILKTWFFKEEIDEPTLP